MTAPAPHALWIGTYPERDANAGSGEGIWRVDVDATGRFRDARLAVRTPAPSFLAVHPGSGTLYAVHEGNPGEVSAFPVGADGTLGDAVTVASGGSSPCHLLALDDVVWVANYGDGAATARGVDPVTGAWAPETAAILPGAGSGPQGDRQEGPHAHFVAAVGPDVLVVDLGADVVRRYAQHPEPPTGGTESAPAAHAAWLPPGTGPRHLVALDPAPGAPGPGALVVAGELDAHLHVLTPAGPGAWTPSSATPATVAGPVPGERSYPSHLAAWGDLLLLGVRGADVLAVHRVTRRDDGTPVVEPLADTGLGAGAWPRHHAVLGLAADGRLLVVVANQGRDELVSVLVDAGTGAGEVVDRLAFPTPPVCVLDA